MMKNRNILAFIGIFLIVSVCLQAQETESQEELAEPDKLFVRATIYPTANLSRYDYNNDVDLYEVRAYVELRDKTPIGDLIDNARVFVNSNLLDYKTDHYEKRIRIAKESLIEELDLRIKTQDGRIVKNTFLIPTWLILLNPRPEIIQASKDLLINWKYTRFEAPVDVFAYNFKTGKMIFEKPNLYNDEVMLPANLLPESTIVRVWVMQSWLYKRYLVGSSVVPGSEVVVIPWSQVFFRTE
ncbi:MAG: hypothetical protein JSV17_01940 [Candidatus Aminicenantes bacterium]|nr:MAG: hypothetical protein JSV17_01940 [Candidatus Aminicenantes bacterium]